MKKKIYYIKSNSYSFKKWSRKSYAVFNSLKIVIKICVLSSIYNIINGQTTESPVNDTLQIIKTIGLEEVEVIGQRTPTVFSNIARIVDIIPLAQIQTSPAQSVQELLDYYGGIDIRQRGYFGIQADANIRGGTFDQTQILLNGINISDPQTGHYSFNLPFDFENIQRVEIVKGPSARVLGSNAYTGAINIVTETTDSNNIYISVNKGSFNYYKLNSAISYKLKNTSNSVYFSNSSSDGYTNFTGFKTYNVFYNGKAVLNNTVLKYHAGYDYKDYEANSYYSSKYPEQYETIKITIAALKTESGKNIKLLTNTYWKRLNDHYSMVIDSTYTFHVYNLIDLFGINVNLNITTTLGRTSLGIEHRTENIYSSNRGNDLGNPVKMPGYDSVFLNKGFLRSNLEYFLEHNVNYKDFYASAGIMINWNSGSDNKLIFIPGIDVSYKFMNSFKLFATANKTQRLPTFTDMFYNATDTYGNENLKPETALSIESGIKINNEFYNGHISCFFRKGENNIDWVYVDSVARWHAENIAEISANGIEVASDLNIQNAFSKKIFLNHLYISYTFINIIKTTGEKESKYALDNLKHKFSLISDLNLPEHFGANISLTYQDRMGKYDIYDPAADSAIFKPYPSVLLVDGKLFWNWKNLHWYIQINNIFDTRYRDIGNIIQPGRLIITGLHYKFNL